MWKSVMSRIRVESCAMWPRLLAVCLLTSTAHGAVPWRKTEEKKNEKASVRHALRAISSGHRSRRETQWSTTARRCATPALERRLEKGWKRLSRCPQGRLLSRDGHRRLGRRALHGRDAHHAGRPSFPPLPQAHAQLRAWSRRLCPATRHHTPSFLGWPRQRVAAQMINRSGYYAPDYVLNVGGRGYDSVYSV